MQRPCDKNSGEKLVVFGFGAQGSAHAKNLRDSGEHVTVCLPPENRRIEEAYAQGFTLATNPAAAAREAETAAILIPDSKQAALYNDTLAKNLPKGALLVFAHGFAIHYKQIKPRPDLDVVLCAPLAQGATVREDFEKGGGVPCLIAVAQDATGHAREKALDYARSISKSGPFIDTTFAEEVEIDLFVEQAVLCGGLPELIRRSFESLVNAGYNKDIAYFCCLKELRAIVTLLDQHSIAGMRKQISDTALYGAVTRGPMIIDANVCKTLDNILGEIRSGKFAEEIIKKPGMSTALAEAAMIEDEKHEIEKVHRKFESY